MTNESTNPTESTKQKYTPIKKRTSESWATFLMKKNLGNVGRPLNISTPKELEIGISNYLDSLDEFNSNDNNRRRLPTFQGLYYFLGVEDFDSYKNKKDYSPLIKRFRSLLIDDRLQESKQPAKDIFVLKNLDPDNFKDKIEVENNINTVFSLADLHKEASSLVEQEELESKTIIEGTVLDEEDTNS